MDKARKKFVLYAIISVFVLLTALLSVINVINFAKVAEDADSITEMLSQSSGYFDGPETVFKDENGGQQEGQSEGQPGGEVPPEQMTPGSQLNTGTQEQGETSGTQPGNNGGSAFQMMGPKSPETSKSVRYFTFAFDSEGNARQVAYEISAVTAAEAEEWARSLMTENTGWTRTYYRYRVYKTETETLVTVIDQGRELSTSYRILLVSVIGGVIVLAAAAIFLILVSRKLFEPVSEADRKQKQFIAEIEKNFKIPLTVLNADAELLERENGESESTLSIRKQVKSMTALVKDLGALSVLDDGSTDKMDVSISEILISESGKCAEKLEKAGIKLTTDIDPNIQIKGDPARLIKMCDELLDNLPKFALTHAEVTLKEMEGHVVLETSNDADLSDGEINRIFDRFTRLDNAKNKEGSGLGLSYVKETAKAHEGRTEAYVKDGIAHIIIRI